MDSTTLIVSLSSSTLRMLRHCYVREFSRRAELTPTPNERLCATFCSLIFPLAIVTLIGACERAEKETIRHSNGSMADHILNKESHVRSWNAKLDVAPFSADSEFRLKR